MPKISQKCDYGLRALMELTRRQGEGPVSVSEISACQGIPQRFLELIIKELRQAGVVRSHRGAKGGYTLAADPESLTLGQIVRLLDGPLSLMDCMSCGGERYCPLQGRCALAGVWREAEAALGELYDSVTFRSLLREEPEEEQQQVGKAGLKMQPRGIALP